jgi:hypothetical protein
MKQQSVARTGIERGLLAASLALGVGLSAGSAIAAEGLNQHADEILQSMSKFLAGTKAFSVTADISNEFITTEAQKLQLNSHATVLMERPSRFQATRKGRFADVALFFDGGKLTVYGKTANAYLQRDVAGTIDQAIAALEAESGLSLPGADLLLSNPYKALTSGATSSGYHGMAYVGGVQCHHLSFRTPQIDWQIWVKDGAEPLPMKYVITTKWMTGAPQYSVALRDWNTKPAITADKFKFVVPQGATRLQALAVDETGEFAPSGEGK